MNELAILEMREEHEKLSIDVNRLMRLAEFFPEVIARIDYIFDLLEGTVRLKNEVPIKEFILTLKEGEQNIKKAFAMLAAELRKKQTRVDDLAGKIPSSNY